MRKLLIPVLMLTTACSMTPDYHTPQVETPAAWSVPTAAATHINADWWSNFSSSELNALESQALAGNTDLAASLARIDQARASLKIAQGGLLPSVSGDVSLGKNVVSNGSDGADWRGGFNVSYETDLFGAVRAKVASAGAGLQASEFDKAALALVVTGDVARGYFTLVNLRERLAVADQNIANASEVLRIIQVRLSAGAVSPLEVAQQQSALSSAQASRTALAQQENAAANALSVLLGKPPQSQTFKTSLGTINIPAIAAGVPSDVLQQRPDIRRSEAQLVAANANIGAARAALYPSLSLSAGGSHGASFGDPAASALSLAASLAAPIFNGGRLQGGVEQADARQQELIANYRGTVLMSFKEVEDALTAVNAAQAREVQLTTAAQAAQQSYDLSRVRFDSGSIDFQTLLNAQQTLLSSQDTLASVRLERLYAAVDLYKALGGGWKP